jgi:hypothetical protein
MAILQPVERPEHHASLEFDDDEQRLLDLVDGTRSLFELCEQGPMSPGANARVLYAFLCLKMIGPDRSSGAIRIQVRDR